MQAPSKRARTGSAGLPPLTINVGGTFFMTTRATLCAEKGSMLATMFEEDSPFGELNTDETGTIFLDSDPATFTWILNYLRRNCAKPPKSILEQLRADADYFGITGLTDLIDARVEALEKAAGCPVYRYAHVSAGKGSYYLLRNLNLYGAEGYRVVRTTTDDGEIKHYLMEKVCNSSREAGATLDEDSDESD